MTELFLFDLDDTLVDHSSAAAAAIDGWIHDAGFPTTVDGVSSGQLWHDIAEQAFPAYFAGQVSFVQQRRSRIQAFLPRMGVPVDEMSEDELDAHFARYRLRYEAAWQPFPDVVDTLTQLRQHGALIAVLTNGDQAQQEDKISRTGLAALVDATFASSNLPAAKPDPAAFLTVLDRLTMAPAAAVYVGDKLDTDARAATAAGLTGI